MWMDIDDDEDEELAEEAVVLYDEAKVGVNVGLMISDVAIDGYHTLRLGTLGQFPPGWVFRGFPIKLSKKELCQLDVREGWGRC